jgi:hypothetical protein
MASLRLAIAADTLLRATTSRLAHRPIVRLVNVRLLLPGLLALERFISTHEDARDAV